MKVAYKDLLNLLSKKPSKDSLSKKLFQLGHEHEVNGDIFDMELTPNRGDCLSLIGLARDLGVFFDAPKAFDLHTDTIETLELDFENRSPLDCPKISFLEIEVNESKFEYQPYLKNYINLIGNKKTNLFTDISNFVSYELGQPTHCFDRQSINKKLIFENKKCNTAFQTLLGTEINLKDRNCVFSLDNEIISLAGVMGGFSTACSTKTTKVLVECAYFNPESIIGQSIKYNLVSDAAHKFERGVDIDAQEHALRRFAKVVQDHAEIKSIKLKTFSMGVFQNLTIPIDIGGINKILGTNFKKDECLGYLRGLGFGVSNKIKVPAYRHDIKTNNDLAEEIARVVGYNNIASSSINLHKIVDPNRNEKVTKIESLLTSHGFSEVINFPFTSKKETKSINIDNPLDKNRKNLRISLKDSLVDNLLYNERRQKDSIKLFELSTIYTKDTKINQQIRLGIIVSGRLANNYNDFSKKLDYKYLNKILNDNLCTNIFEINEIPRNTLPTKKKDKILYVEVSLEDIPNTIFSSIESNKKVIDFVSFKPVSEYPSSKRDFSFLIKDLNKVDEVINILDSASGEIIKNLFIFDFYKDNKKSSVKLGCRFIFQSNYKTLSDAEINEKALEIINPIIEIDGVSIPGL
jgi:phenylalanyl-tRNA synthetase beta chain